MGGPFGNLSGSHLRSHDSYLAPTYNLIMASQYTCGRCHDLMIYTTSKRTKCEGGSNTELIKRSVKRSPLLSGRSLFCSFHLKAIAFKRIPQRMGPLDNQSPQFLLTNNKTRYEMLCGQIILCRSLARTNRSLAFYENL